MSLLSLKIGKLASKGKVAEPIDTHTSPSHVRQTKPNQLSKSKPSSRQIATAMIDRLYLIFIALVTLICILGTVDYWSLIMGISKGGAYRFDIAPTHWRVAGTVLCLLMPLTALGIWFQTGFGPWGWLLITIIHFFMYGVMDDYFGTRPILLGVNIVILFLFVCFQILFYRRDRSIS